jgi:surfeit locus 1 family protein
MTRQHIETAAGLLLAAGLVLVFCLLGNWQLQRMAHKQQLLDSQAHAITQAQLPLARALAQGSAVVAVADCGQWQPLQLLLDNQQRGGRAGHITYQLLRTDAGQPVLVELGWRGWDGQRSPPAIELLHGHHCLQGQLLPAPAIGLRMAQAPAPLPTAGGWLLTALDTAQVAALAGLEQAQLPDAILRPDPMLPLGYARDMALLPNTLPPQKHLGYAVQWFALAGAVVLLALLLTLRGWRGRQGRGGRGRMP